MASFWFDAGGGEPIVYLNQKDPKPSKPNISLQKALPLVHHLLPSPHNLRTLAVVDSVNNLSFSEGQDKIFRKWSRDGMYSSKSTYKHFVSVGKILTPARWIWKLKIPPKVKLFGILLLQGKLPTQQALLKRNILVDPDCVICSSTLIEDDLHLFFKCPFAISLWIQIENLIGLHVLPEKNSTLQTVLEVFASLTGSAREKKLCVMFTTLWMLWRERNNRRFRSEEVHVQVLARRIIHEGKLFFKNC